MVYTKKEEPYKITKEGEEEVLTINYEDKPYSPSIEDNPLVMMDAIDKLIELYYPDIRSMINRIDELHLDGKKILDEEIYNEQHIYLTIYNLIIKKKFTDARKLWLENGIDLSELLNYFYHNVYKGVFTSQQKIDLIFLLAEAEFRMKFGADPEITFSAFILKFMEKLE